MKPICRSKTFQKGEDIQEAVDFFFKHLDYEVTDSPYDGESNLKYKTIITITKVVEDDTKITNHEERD